MPTLVLSVPLAGPTGQAGADAAEGVRLAFEDTGSPVELVVLNAGPGICGRHARANAEGAASEGSVVGYLGEFHSAATELSLPVLEAGGVPHVSFSSSWARPRTIGPASCSPASTSLPPTRWSSGWRGCSQMRWLPACPPG
jgi:ABC-type branched-subunit amino acid transport system substrate-binding protein